MFGQDRDGCLACTVSVLFQLVSGDKVLKTLMAQFSKFIFGCFNERNHNIGLEAVQTYHSKSCFARSNDKRDALTNDTHGVLATKPWDGRKGELLRLQMAGQPTGLLRLVELLRLWRRRLSSMEKLKRMAKQAVRAV